MIWEIVLSDPKPSQVSNSGLYRENGKKTEATIECIYIYIYILAYIGIMEKEMKATIVHIYIGLYRDNETENGNDYHIYTGFG